ncbi:MAG: hypothetical protein QOH41_62 [Blastocatellia bacterium]|jgi:hypothetical protein|nr:hypothetical protein [Blastocatellia bacterium]
MSTTRLATTTRRLPGLSFEAQSPPLADALPRMDVAVFVGFASSGPIDQPVVIEDSAQFAAIFGEDAPLAWDAERGLMMRAYLGPTVRDFFRQGGSRCWIIRVARDAKYNYFPIPALLELRANGDLFPAFARARSEGSWSDALLAGTSLQSHPIEVTSASFATHHFELSPNSPADVQPGDLLRFELHNEGCGLFGVAESVQAVEQDVSSPPSEEISSAKQRRVAQRRTVRVQLAKPFWFKTHWLDGLSRKRVSPVRAVNADGSVGPPLNVAGWSLSSQGQSIALWFASSLDVPQAGSNLLVDHFDVQLLVTVQSLEDGEPFIADSPLPETVLVSGKVDRLILPQPSQALVFNHKSESQVIGVAGRPSIEGREIKLNCSLPLADAPAPGTVMRVDFGVRKLWLTVREVISIAQAGGSDPTGSVQIAGGGFWPLAGAPSLSPDTPVAAERLNFDLLVRKTADTPLRLTDLGFDESHQRYWGGWPTDEQRYRAMKTPAFMAGANETQAGAREFFPLAESSNSPDLNSGKSDKQPSPVLYLPLAMPFMDGAFLGAGEQRQSARERDGLALVGVDGKVQATPYSDLFLDPDLIDATLENLLSQADYLRYQRPIPRDLLGIHAALDIEEATIIAVPDAVHRGWKYETQESVPPEASVALPHPERWRYLDCNPPPAQVPLEKEPRRENFLDCDLRVLDPPEEFSRLNETPTGTITLVWKSVADATRYVVEESRDPAWNGAEVIYSGPQTRLVIYGRSAGDYFYRIRVETAAVTSDWSSGISVQGSTTQWQIEKRESYEAAPLLAVHRALLRLCAARADLFAVLALPEHYREDDAITHAEILRPANGSLFRARVRTEQGDAQVAPLSLGEEQATSYGALYHPWFVTRRDDFLEPWQLVPPDGAACGVMAQRALTRGAWIAPANELLRGVVALSPPLARERRQELQDAQVNIFRHEPRGFLSLGADTLSRDIDLRPINVRRLLILLRRLALRLGETYVFEPNDDSFRRLVQRGFEAALDRMFARGAFAGRTAATSYQVNTDVSLNTPASVDQGRFIVELKVAPSLPLTFITVRLVQTNDGSMVTEVR